MKFDIILNNKLISDSIGGSSEYQKLDYHNSWNELIAAMKKFIAIPLNPTSWSYLRQIFLLKESLADMDIEKTYKLFIKTIILYNTIKNETNENK